jgi:hypothetical protein
LKKKFVCAVCFFAEFALSKDIHFDCEFCDSTLILSRFSASESVASLIFSSILKNFANENQLSVSFLSMKKKKLKLKKKLFLFFVLLFASSSIRRLKIYSFLFFLLRNRLNDCLLFWVRERTKSFKQKK